MQLADIWFHFKTEMKILPFQQSDFLKEKHTTQEKKSPYLTILRNQGL